MTKQDEVIMETKRAVESYKMFGNKLPQIVSKLDTVINESNKCKFCGEGNASFRDPITKDIWHVDCHKKIIKLPSADEYSVYRADFSFYETIKSNLGFGLRF
jgi:hypothetical protein